MNIEQNIPQQTNSSKIALSQSWKNHLLSEFEKPYMQNLRNFLISQIRLKKTIYPTAQNYFTAFNTLSFEDVRVVILGQDPYHGPHQAHGLCFSVPPNVKIPPSLNNIFKELKADIGTPIPPHGCLLSWAKKGVFLLNAILTVEKGKAGSHQNKGWEIFTDKVIDILNKKKKHLVFMLWGSFAQKKGAFIDREKHLVLKAAHPSPFSADRGFFGSSPFSKANNYLSSHSQKEIDWSLS